MSFQDRSRTRHKQHGACLIARPTDEGRVSDTGRTIAKRGETVSNGERVAIYEWQAKQFFLFSVLCRSSLRIEANAGDWADDVLRKLSGDIRLFAFHLNLTQTASFPHNRAALCRDLSRADIFVVNAEVTNISKAFIQASCRRLGLPSTEAAPDGDPDERVIIKTNLNYGGLGEKVLNTQDLRVLGWSASQCPLDATSYKVLKRRDVAVSDWDNPALFIERFVHNHNDRFCRVYLLSDYIVVSEVVDPSVLKRMPGGIDRKNWFYQIQQDGFEAIGATSTQSMSVARQVRSFVRALRIDFAALDIVLDDDERSYIIDVNTTPSWRDTVEPEVERFLRAVLDGLVARKAPLLPI